MKSRKPRGYFAPHELHGLINLADRRLYMAKSRGRNQIEPDMDHWRKIQN